MIQNSPQKTLSDIDVLTKTVLKAWSLQVARIDEFIAQASDEALSTDTAPGRNSGVYLVGHLTAVSDGLFPLLGFGSKIYPELEKLFISTPDKAGLEYPTLEQLKESWRVVNDKLMERFNSLEPEQWLGRHEAISEDDFAKDPFRNRLNVLINRTAHMSYHLGQLVYLKPKKE
jgi:DinB superfamily